jgi:hypothetical protein
MFTPVTNDAKWYSLVQKISCIRQEMSSFFSLSTVLVIGIVEVLFQMPFHSQELLYILTHILIHMDHIKGTYLPDVPSC